MNSADRKNYYLSRFEDHRQLLRTAINAMADGQIVHALQVALEIRVFLHETGNQKPLLKSLASNYSNLPILERFEEPPKDVPPGHHAVKFYCPISAKISQTEGKTTVGLITDLDAPEYKLSTLGHWWGSACMVLPGIGPVIRRDLILNLADKEAAHVDPKVSEGYQNILGSGFIRFQFNGEDAALNISRLVVGKCGVEFLHCLDKSFPPPEIPKA